LEEIEKSKRSTLDSLRKKSREDRRAAKQMLGKLDILSQQLVHIPDGIRRQAQKLQGVKEMKAAVQAMRDGAKLAGAQREQLGKKVGELRGLFQEEKRQLSELGQASGEEMKVLKANRQLLKKLESEQKEFDLDALLGALSKYEEIADQRKAAVEQLTTTLEFSKQKNERYQSLLGQVDQLLELGEQRLEIQQRVGRLKGLVSSKKWTRATAKSALEEIQAVEGLLSTKKEEAKKEEAEQ
ncbi:MAG: hypothetical protein KR126chlam2_01331, partial [Chlamydiae bacterium]|nr:hypothetical protein [Chlamydiota bacterium]